MINNIVIGERIKNLRKEKGWTQDKLAERLSKKRQTISAWEDGRITLTVDKLIEICNLFECDMGYILGEHDTKKRITADIQEVIGLSEEAIALLMLCVDSKDNFLSQKTILDTINNLLEYKEIDLICLSVSNYIESVKLCKYVEECNGSMDFSPKRRVSFVNDNNSEMQILYEYHEEKGSQDFKIYNIQRRFIEFVKSLGDFAIADFELDKYLDEKRKTIQEGMEFEKTLAKRRLLIGDNQNISKSELKQIKAEAKEEAERWLNIRYIKKYNKESMNNDNEN